MTEWREKRGGEIRVEDRADGGKMFVGYGAVFHRDGDPGTEYQLGKDLVERIAPTAFDRALSQKQDTLGLFNHDPNYVLGAVSSGTMRLSTDKTGLRYEIDYNEADPQHVSVMQKVQRKDVKGSSFSFRINGKAGQRFDKGDGVDVRNIIDVDLFDTGPVAMPAYSSTTTGMRSGDCDDAVEARNQWAAECEAERVAVRMRQIEVG